MLHFFSPSITAWLLGCSSLRCHGNPTAQGQVASHQVRQRVSPTQRPHRCVPVPATTRGSAAVAGHLEAPRMPLGPAPHPAQQVALGFPPGGGGEPRAVSGGDSGEDSPLPEVCPRRPHIPDVPPPCPGIICLYPRYEQAFMEQLLWMRHLMYVTSKPHSFAKDLRFLSHHRWWD